MTRAEMCVIDVRGKLSLIAGLLRGVMGRTPVKGTSAESARAIIDAHAAILRADAALATLILWAEVGHEGEAYEGQHQEDHPAGGGRVELSSAGSADERGRVAAGGRPDGERHEEVIVFRPRTFPVRAPLSVYHSANRRPAMTDKVRSRRSRTDVDPPVDNPAITRAGDENVDPAAGGPQPQDVSVDYATRNIGRDRAAMDSGDGRSNPSDAPGDPIE